MLCWCETKTSMYDKKANINPVCWRQWYNLLPIIHVSQSTVIKSICRCWTQCTICMVCLWTFGSHSCKSSAVASNSSISKICLYLWSLGLGRSTFAWVSSAFEGFLLCTIFQVSFWSTQCKFIVLYCSILAMIIICCFQRRDIYRSLINAFEEYRYDNWGRMWGSLNAVYGSCMCMSVPTYYAYIRNLLVLWLICMHMCMHAVVVTARTPIEEEN